MYTFTNCIYILWLVVFAIFAAVKTYLAGLGIIMTAVIFLSILFSPWIITSLIPHFFALLKTRLLRRSA